MFLQNFAQTAGECTVNGQPVDCGEAAQAAGGIIAGIGIFMLLFFIFGIFSTVIWILSLVHLVQHEDVDNRILWIVLVTIVPLANFVYYFGFRRSYEKHKAGGGQTPPDVSGSAPGNTPVSTPGVVSPKENSDSGMAATPAGGAAAASGFSDQPSTPTSQPVADGSDPQDIASQSISETPEESTEVAQAESAPAYTGENSSSETSSETTETVAPETDSFQSGSTEEPKLPSEDSSSETGSDSSDSSGDDSANQPDGGPAGPNLG